MIKIKFCGLKRIEDIEAANIIKPDYIGFVFAKKSKRYVDFGTAAKLKETLNPNIKAVGVFVDEEPETIAKLYTEGIIRIAQLHGSEDEAYIKKLRSLADLKLIKAFGVSSKEDILRAEESSADLILVDGKSPGSGNSFDWRLLEDIKRPYILAGGLNRKTVKEALEKLNPYGVDVSSGIETEGFKDAAKMKEFADCIRGVKQ